MVSLAPQTYYEKGQLLPGSVNCQRGFVLTMYFKALKIMALQ